MSNFTWSYSGLSLFKQCPRKFYRTRISKDIKEEEQDHLDSRKDKRRKMGLKGNMSLPRERRKHRGGRGRLGDTKLLPIPKGRDD